MPELNFDDYDGLKDAIAAWLRRSDLNDQIPSFVYLAETKMNKRVRAREMIRRGQATISNEYESLPPGFIKMVSVQLLVNDQPTLGFVSPASFGSTANSSTPEQPRNYTIIGGQLRFSPPPDADYPIETQFYQKLTHLSDDNPTTALLQAAPDLYLYGSLLEAMPYMRNDARIEVWGAGFEQAIQRVNDDATEGDYSAAPLVMQVS